MSAALWPQMPFSAMRTTSPRSRMLVMTASMPAWPVEEMARVKALFVYKNYKKSSSIVAKHLFHPAREMVMAQVVR